MMQIKFKIDIYEYKYEYASIGHACSSVDIEENSLNSESLAPIMLSMLESAIREAEEFLINRKVVE
jgi:hypothetical protein